MNKGDSLDPQQTELSQQSILRIGVLECPGQLDLSYTNNPGFSAKKSRVIDLLKQAGMDGKRLIPIGFTPSQEGLTISQMGLVWQTLEKSLATRIVVPLDWPVLAEASAMLKILHHHAMARHTIITCGDRYPILHQASTAAFSFGIAIAKARLLPTPCLLIATCQTLNDHYQQQQHPLHFITLGGTLDKDPLLPAPHVGPPVVATILQRVAFTAPWKLTEICRKDSNEIGSFELETTWIAIQDHAEQLQSPIIITCGTDRMTEIARALQSQLKNLAQPIIFTGAITPYWIKNPKLEDALFNLGFAMQAALLLKPGIYIAMHGEIFTSDKVHK